MEELELSIIFRGSDKTFPCHFSQVGYTYRFVVSIDGHEVIFEHDEERNFRARMETQPDHDPLLREQIALVAAELEKQLK